jgi:hypothetical protein
VDMEVLCGYGGAVTLPSIYHIDRYLRIHIWTPFLHAKFGALSLPSSHDFLSCLRVGVRSCR